MENRFPDIPQTSYPLFPRISFTIPMGHNRWVTTNGLPPFTYETRERSLLIHLENISRVYRDGERQIRALTAIELIIPPGATVGLVGKSGSGKSTLLHLVGGLEWPSTGRVVVDGRDLRALGDAELTAFRLHRIGFVFQFFHLLPALTVLENLLLPAELAGRPRAAGRERARALLAEVGLSEREGTYPERLSGGEQQRIAVARALMLEPPVLLADEPTGTLDSENGERVMALLHRLARDQGATLVVATHSREVAARTGRLIELRDGRVVSDSAPVPPPPSGQATGATVP